MPAIGRGGIQRFGWIRYATINGRQPVWHASFEPGTLAQTKQPAGRVPHDSASEATALCHESKSGRLYTRIPMRRSRCDRAQTPEP